MKRVYGGIGCLLAVMLLAQVVATAQSEIEGRYRIRLMSGRMVEGDVTQQADGSYKVKTKYGIVVTVRRNEVAQITPLEEQVRDIDKITRSSGETRFVRRAISDAEIEEIIAGIEVEIDAGLLGASPDDLMAPLPLDEGAVEEMLRLATLPIEGGVPMAEQENVLVRPHFVMVYTAERDSALRLAARLESVWRWNVRFVQALGLKPVRPEKKLEVFYFGTHKEFESYTLNQGIVMPAGALGYYKHDINRSHFFDLTDMPMLAGLRDELENDDLPADQRRRLRNKMESYVEYQNMEVIQHETGHHIHHNIGVFRRDLDATHAPVWLVEGATMLFEVPPAATGRGGAGLGEQNDVRLHQFRQHFPNEMTPRGFRSFLFDDNVWMNGQYDYPRGWAVVYYLWRRHREQLGTYIDAVYNRDFGSEVDRGAREREFEDCFGDIDDEFVEDFYDFIENLRVRPSRLPPEL